MGNGELPLNHRIVYQLQDILNLLPDVTKNNFTEVMQEKNNDQMMIIFLSSIIRSVISLDRTISKNLVHQDAEESGKVLYLPSNHQNFSESVHLHGVKHKINSSYRIKPMGIKSSHEDAFR